MHEPYSYHYFLLANWYRDLPVVNGIISGLTQETFEYATPKEVYAKPKTVIEFRGDNGVRHAMLR